MGLGVATDTVTVTRGIGPELRERTAQLYDIAFGEKLALAIPDTDDRINVLSKSMQLDYAIGAFDSTDLVGLAGFSTASGSLTSGIDYRGLLSAARRLYERLGFCAQKTEHFEFLRGVLGFGSSTTMIYRL